MNNKTKLTALVVIALILIAWLWFKLPQINGTPIAVAPKAADNPSAKPSLPTISPPSAVQPLVVSPVKPAPTQAPAATVVSSAPVVIADQSQIDAARTFVTDGVGTPLMAFRLNTGHYPFAEDGLRALIENVNGATGWHGPYLASGVNVVPLDPWGHEYQYLFPGVHNTKGYDCWSMGPDGVSGTADDIGNW